MKKFLPLLIIFIITIPSFFSLLNDKYFTMHDDQHVARLALLDRGLREGYLYPRWVDTLGFGFGYPLYNFYPPAIYFIAEIFHLVGFSYLWSIKLLIFLGFFLAASGIYLFMKKIVANTTASVLSAVLYTYFFYHATLVYVRGALAEFFTLAILPLVFLTIFNLYKNANLKNSLLFGVILALLILTHPFIALPSLFFIFISSLFFLFQSTDKIRLIKFQFIGLVTALLLSSFFWLPSLSERRFTLVDKILTKELANYKLHYVFPSQFWYSPWGYGGSIAGPFDGLTFQLGKLHVGFVIFSVLLAILYFLKKNKFDDYLKNFTLFLSLLLFSLFMCTSLSSFIWDNIKYLWYLQFPWRFLTFANLFIAITGAYSIFFISEIVKVKDNFFRIGKYIAPLLLIATFLVVLFKYQKYFHPQKYLDINDRSKTSFEEIAWRVSRSSFEFIPRGVVTKKSELGTTITAITPQELPRSPFEVLNGRADIKILENKSADKKFQSTSNADIFFKLNTYNFPGWVGYIDSNKIAVDDNNKYKLITVTVPAGQHIINFKFENTPIRNVANFMSAFSAFAIIFFFLKSRYLVNSKR